MQHWLGHVLGNKVKIGLWRDGLNPKTGYMLIVGHEHVVLSQIEAEHLRDALVKLCGPKVSENPWLTKHVEDLPLPGDSMGTRIRNALRGMELGHVCSHTEAEFLRTPNLSRKSLDVFKTALNAVGLHMGIDVIKDPDPLMPAHEVTR